MLPLWEMQPAENRRIHGHTWWADQVDEGKHLRSLKAQGWCLEMLSFGSMKGLLDHLGKKKISSLLSIMRWKRRLFLQSTLKSESAKKKKKKNMLGVFKPFNKWIEVCNICSSVYLKLEGTVRAQEPGQAQLRAVVGVVSCFFLFLTNYYRHLNPPPIIASCSVVMTGLRAFMREYPANTRYKIKWQINSSLCEHNPFNRI